MCTFGYHKPYSRMLIGALFVIAQMWKALKCPSVWNGQIKHSIPHSNENEQCR